MTASRGALKEYLCDQIKMLEAFEPSALQHKQLEIFIEAVRGIDALDLGETPPIFAPSKVQTWGTRPAAVRWSQAQAIGHVKLLRMLGLSKKQALEQVASAYSRTTNSMRHWEKSLLKHPVTKVWVDVPVNQFKSYRIFGSPSTTSMAAVLSKIKQDGKSFKSAQTQKKSPKK